MRNYNNNNGDLYMEDVDDFRVSDDVDVVYSSEKFINSIVSHARENYDYTTNGDNYF